MRRFLFALLLALVPTIAFGQGAILQGGPWTPGHAPMYVGQGSSQPVVQDSGPAGGGAIGTGLSELNVTARGTGTAPYIGQGTGPYGSIGCFYDAPITNSTGYHYLCFSPNASTDTALLAFGAGGGASQIGLEVVINGITYPFPAALSEIVIGAPIINGINSGIL